MNPGSSAAIKKKSRADEERELVTEVNLARCAVFLTRETLSARLP